MALDHRERIALVVRAQHENIHRAQHVRYIAAQPEKVDLPCHSDIFSLLFQLFPQRSFSSQHQVDVSIRSGTLGEGFQQQLVVLLGSEPCHATE